MRERERERERPPRCMHRSLSATARDKAAIAVFVVRHVVARWERGVEGEGVEHIAPCGKIA